MRQANTILLVLWLLGGCLATPDEPVAMPSDGQPVGATTGRSAQPILSGTTSVIFSPQSYAQSHLVEVARRIDAARRSIDIAMYNLTDVGIRDALQRAVGRGVSIRMIYEPARTERLSPSGTRSAGLEQDGIDVRYINTIMHHKFAIIDGPRSSVDQAESTTLISGSGNWSVGAGTRYDENTLLLTGVTELSLRFQHEFNRLWNNSRDFIYNGSLQFFASIPIAESAIPDDPRVHAYFTSDNFRVYESATYGPTFSVVRGKSTVADEWVEAIRSARQSIRIASGHMRSRPVYDALLAKKQKNQGVQIRIYLDGQEWLSEWAHEGQVRERNQCLKEADTSEARIEDCYDRDFMYGYALDQQPGIDICFKYYAYRWDIAYALQMHHKYMVIDDRLLVTGSYNLSDNAEHHTMENIILFDASAQPAVVSTFIDNFEALWSTRTGGTYDRLLAQVQSATDDFPIVFDPMSLTWAQIDVLKDAIRRACPAVDTAEYRDNPARHRFCHR